MTIAPVFKYTTATGIDTTETTRQVASHTYYNMAGMASDKPFPGMNIVVTRYSDGSQTATKTIR